MVALIIPAIVGALAAAMGSLIGRAIIALGMGYVTYKGLGAGIDTIKARVIENVQGLPAEVVGMIGFLWIDKALTIIMASVATALSVRLISGSFKKMVLK